LCNVHFLIGFASQPQEADPAAPSTKRVSQGWVPRRKLLSPFLLTSLLQCQWISAGAGRGQEEGIAKAGAWCALPSLLFLFLSLSFRFLSTLPSLFSALHDTHLLDSAVHYATRLTVLALPNAIAPSSLIVGGFRLSGLDLTSNVTATSTAASTTNARYLACACLSVMCACVSVVCVCVCVCVWPTRFLTFNSANVVSNNRTKSGGSHKQRKEPSLPG
jgi:hypothetical protein